MIARRIAGVLAIVLIAMPADSQTGRSIGDDFQIAFAGRWTGEANQNTGGKSYAIRLDVKGAEVDTDYPELKCAGKLARIAASGDYVIFQETITHGRFEDGGSCADAIVILAPAGSNLAFGNFVAHGGEALVTWALLARQK